MEHETLLTLTADIVVAHVSHNKVEFDEVPALIGSVYGALADAGNPEPFKNETEPAVSVRSSVRPSTLTCLECGAKLKLLKRHLANSHNLSPAEYRSRWKLPANYPMITPEYSAKRKALAIKFGLGRKDGEARKGRKRPAKGAVRTN